MRVISARGLGLGEELARSDRIASRRATRRGVQDLVGPALVFSQRRFRARSM
jgi:hypothetical protein